MDAARGEVFAQRYVPAPGEWLGVRAVGEPISARPADVAAAWSDDGPVVSHWIGDGVGRYRERIGEGQVLEPTPLLAPLVARLGTLAAAAGQGGAPHALRPLYVRPSDVELARDKKARG